MTTIYQTATRRQAERFRYWSSLMCRTFAPAHGHVEDAEGFDARFAVSELGETTVCTVSAPKQFWERTRQHVRSAPRDDFQFTQLLTGQGVLRQDGRELILRPGMMSVYDVNRPYTYEVDGDALFVKLPRKSLIERIGDTPPGCAVAVDSDGAVATWASGVVRQAAVLDSFGSSEAAGLIGSSVLSAVAALLSKRPAALRSAPDAGESNSILSRVCAYIQTHLSDPDLCLTSIARAQGLSERTLNRLFVILGVTPMRWVLQQRLALSRRALEQDGVVRITDIAFSHGFNDLSHFSRIFKKAYSVTPQQHAVAVRGRSSPQGH